MRPKRLRSSHQSSAEAADGAILIDGEGAPPLVLCNSSWYVRVSVPRWFAASSDEGRALEGASVAPDISDAMSYRSPASKRPPSDIGFDDTVNVAGTESTTLAPSGDATGKKKRGYNAAYYLHISSL